MKEKDIAQRIIAMYNSQSSSEEKKQFVHLLKDMIKIIEKMNREDFAQFVDDFEKHLDQIDTLKDSFGIGD